MTSSKSFLIIGPGDNIVPIAYIVYMLFVIVGIRFDMSFITSILVTFILEWIKEFIIDNTGDLKDFAVTMLGGATVGIPILLIYLYF